MTRRFRLLRDGASSGPWNMGVDEALLVSAGGEGVASLRFYGWRGPWLSLGYAQPLGADRSAVLQAAGVGWVRRSTGGRAVLHGADLTYALAAPADRLPDGLRATYTRIADAVLVALRGLGVPVERSRADAGAPARDRFDCFETAAPDEICLRGRKLAGSAQRRVGNAVLQHGSIRLEADPPGAVAACAGRGESLAGTDLAAHGFRIARERLEDAIVQQLALVLDARFEPAALTPVERRSAAARGAAPAPRP